MIKPKSGQCPSAEPSKPVSICRAFRIKYVRLLFFLSLPVNYRVRLALVFSSQLLRPAEVWYNYLLYTPSSPPASETQQGVDVTQEG